MRLLLPTRLSAVTATVRLLFTTHPRAFIISTVGTLIEPLFYPALLLILHQMLQAITGPIGAVQMNGAVTTSGIILIALLLIQRLAIITRDGSSNILRQQAWVVISARIMHKLPSVPYTLFENNAFQARYGLVIREAAQRSITLVDSLLSTVPILLGVLGLAATLFALAPLMVVALLVIAIPALLTERRLSHAMYALQDRSAPQQLRMDVLTNMQVDADFQRDVRVYQSNLVSSEYTQLAERYLAELKRLTARFLGLRTGAALAQVIGLGLALAAAFALLSLGQLSLASFAVLIPGISMLSGMINAFLYQYRSLRESLLYTEALFDFLTTSFELPTDSPAIASLVAPASRLEAIRLEGISYTYPETQHEALTDISCVFRPGLTAIVGTNGAGKSTLIKLLSGLVAPTSGRLTASLSTGEETSLAACARAILFQEPAHFPFSIRHNVTMRFEQQPEEDERIWEALRQAGLEAVVQALPDGLDTVVGAGFGGVADLSGGQWQRLALARLLYHDAPLIMLDEPSASLDPIGERQIFELLAQLSHEKIILFATHRYDTIRQADTIAVLVDGQLAEMGTHDELERNARDFWSLYLAQGSSRTSDVASS
ncbi:MAG TPA: ABC transporter ATP-binding protein [Ktedonobacteraceae bacterium]|nr:ABC transporter ATP-binding protein [Ktedonobacteraceae bacterium]